MFMQCDECCYQPHHDSILKCNYLKKDQCLIYERKHLKEKLNQAETITECLNLQEKINRINNEFREDKMTKTHTYKEILNIAKQCTTNVEKKHKLGINTKWVYYLAKAILTPKKDIKRIKFDEATKPAGTHISRQLTKAVYIDLAKRLIDYVEKHKQLPNFITYGNYKIRTRLYTLMFAKILVSYSKNNKLPDTVNVNSKAFTKPTETGNTVFNYWVKEFGFKPKDIDDVCDYVLKHFTYQFYFDDKKSNKEVIATKSGNCVDLSQMLINIGEAMGYEWEAIHTQCRQSGTGHIYPRFKKKGTSNWFTRDIACIADESRYCVWCEVPDRGNLLAKNPAWLISNLNR